MPAEALSVSLNALRTEAERAHQIVTKFFANPLALRDYEQILTNEYYAYYDKFRNQVRIISKTEENWVVHCGVETIYGCYRAAHIIQNNLSVPLLEKEKKLAQCARFLRSWVSECERHLNGTP